ncbi:Aminomethyltransferase [Anaerohalosphaera lusitana]|uniref:Aminomethyltransferase n=1 Tax=Anaerohalosphaera lusitana TaxID=1936003 RepID=A0A1U9NRL6_9BACT|nr:aminomethyltransferase family protein [Anaerohalosphaera lusitana]AQT70348.1 Aminomethyltransferase [Anaerohalosphaera lusitana]
MANATPFESVHEKLGANFDIFNAWRMPADFGDPLVEQTAAYETAAAFDLSHFGRIQVKGDDAPALIDYLTATPTAGLTDGSVIWALLIAEPGNITDLVRITRVHNTYTILTSPAKRQLVLELAEKAQQTAGLADVKVSPITEKTAMLALYGPKAADILSRILPFEIDLEPGQVKGVNFFMMNLEVVRGSFIGTDGLELICPKGAASMAGTAIAKYRDRENIVPAGTLALDSALVQAGVPYSITNSTEGSKLTPADLNMTGLVDMNKDFIHKPALEASFKKGTTKTVAGLKTAKGTRHTDLRIQYDDAEIGFCPLTVPSPTLDSNLGLAVIDSEFTAFDEEIQVFGEDLVLPGQLTNLPFDPAANANVCKP